MNIQDTLIQISEKGEEFLDSILQQLLGNKNSLSAKFGRESQLISSRSFNYRDKISYSKEIQRTFVMFCAQWCRKIDCFFSAQCLKYFTGKKASEYDYKQSIRGAFKNA